MYFIKISFIFFLGILIHYCFALSKDCSNNFCAQAEATGLLPILPPITVGEKTYYVETFFTANWYRAAQFCTFNGMRLASFSNQEENDKLVKELLKTYGVDLYFWTSGNDLAEYGSYSWLSTGTNFQFENWWPGEPNHSQGEDNEVEHCVELGRWRNGSTLMWNDRLCSTELYVICELVK